VNFGINELLSYKIQIYLCKPVIPQVQVTVCPQVANLEPVPVPVSTCRTNTMGLPAPVLHPNYFFESEADLVSADLVLTLA
jgi:hypothetical protein